MIAYFKNTANFCMGLGAVLGAVIGYFYFHGHILDNADLTTVFWFALFIILGILIGRVVGMQVAIRKLANVQALLYKESNPDAFLAVFEKVNERVPHNLAEYANGRCLISFAHEAKGEFEQAFDDIKDLDPNHLRIHALTTSSMVVNQKANLWILRKDFLAAQDQIDDLKHLSELAHKRAKMLETNLNAQIRLHEARIAAAKGDANADIDYLKEEIDLSTNQIHKKEMQLELAEYYLRTGKKDEGIKTLREILENPISLYTEKRARELLENPDGYYRYTETVSNETGNTIGQKDADGFVVIRE